MGKKAFHQMIDFLDNHPKGKHCDYYFLEMDSYSDAARKTYESAGFKALPLEDRRNTTLLTNFEIGFRTMIREIKP